MDVTPISGPETVMEHAARLLLEDEARHNLALGILSTARAHPELYPVVEGWVAQEVGRVVGAAIRTPPYNLVVAQPAADGAVEALAEGIDGELPGVVGAVPEVDAFAAAWSRLRGDRPRIRFQQGVYAASRVSDASIAPGAMRLAGAADRDLLLAWVRAFGEETFPDGGETGEQRIRRTVDARLTSDEGGFGIWEVERRPVSVAGFGGETPNGIRIGPVYTPPEYRRQGFASALTAGVSRLQLERGRRFCFLYTDLANPTSNAIYTRIGYERVCDSREIVFSDLG